MKDAEWRFFVQKYPVLSKAHQQLIELNKTRIDKFVNICLAKNSFSINLNDMLMLISLIRDEDLALIVLNEYLNTNYVYKKCLSSKEPICDKHFCNFFKNLKSYLKKNNKNETELKISIDNNFKKEVLSELKAIFTINFVKKQSYSTIEQTNDKKNPYFIICNSTYASCSFDFVDRVNEVAEIIFGDKRELILKKK